MEDEERLDIRDFPQDIQDRFHQICSNVIARILAERAKTNELAILQNERESKEDNNNQSGFNRYNIAATPISS